jgi:DNA-binding transcriptional regulator WhiA
MSLFRLFGSGDKPNPEISDAKATEATKRALLSSLENVGGSIHVFQTKQSFENKEGAQAFAKKIKDAFGAKMEIKELNYATKTKYQACALGENYEILSDAHKELGGGMIDYP